MRNPNVAWVSFFPFSLLVVCPLAHAIDSDASGPKSVTIAVYDTGIGLFSELRLVMLAKGQNTVRFGALPVNLDPATVAVTAPGSSRGMDLVEQQFLYDLGDDTGLLKRYMGKEIAVRGEDTETAGILLSAPGLDGETKGAPLAVADSEGGIDVFPSMNDVSEIVFPGAAQEAYLRPTLLWKVDSQEDAQKNVRLQYSAKGLEWSASYEAVLDVVGSDAYFVGRVALKNGTGGSFDRARIRLVETEKGDAGSDVSPVEDTSLRYAYGRDEPVFGRMVASAGALRTYDVPKPVSLARGETVYALLKVADSVPIDRFYVYDGVQFDRFQRNPRNDWNYGTKSHSIVETYAAFSNVESAGLGVDLPRGRFRLYRGHEDGSVDMIGDAMMPALEPGEKASLLLGPARGLSGERERTGYVEIRPLHEYEESFEIRLENASSEEVVIRVIEHLYRWHTFEIVKANTDYVRAGNQTIEFRPILKPGGQLSIHYTVRYSW